MYYVNNKKKNMHIVIKHIKNYTNIKNVGNKFNL